MSEDSYQMALSPEQAPVYGGGTIVIAFSDNTEFPEKAELYLVFQGSGQRHVTRATQVNEQTLHSIIPAHDTAETIQLQIYLRQDGNCQLFAARHFEYFYDTAHHLAWFLVDSVHDPRALDDLELVRSECFDLANEILSTLDKRLSKAFQHISLPEDWSLLGEDINQNDHEPRDTLFHFCARLGLDDVARFFLDKPGSEVALSLYNRHGYGPKDIAMENNFHGLTELLSEYNSQRSINMGSQRVPYEDGGFYESEGDITTLTTVHELSQRTVEDDIEAVTFIEQRVRGNSLQDINRLHQREFETDWPTKPRSLSDGTVDGFLSNRLSPQADSIIEEGLNQSTFSDVLGSEEIPLLSEENESETDKDFINDSVLDEFTKNLTENQEEDKQFIKNITVNPEDDEGFTQNLTNNQEYSEGFKENLTENQEYSEGFTKNLTENQEESEGFIKNLTKNQENGEGFIKNLTENQENSEGFIKNLTENQEGSEELIKIFPENQEGSEELIKIFTENQEGGEEFIKNLTENQEEDEDSSNPADPSEFTERLHISDEEDPSPDDDNLFTEEAELYVLTDQIVPRPPISPRMVEIPEESLTDLDSTNQNTSVLEASLRQLRGINSGLQKIQTNKFHQRVLQEFRRENLQRFSSSCPSLDENGRQSPLSPVREEEYHKSMLDLIQEGDPASVSLEDQDSDLGSSDNIDPSYYETDPAREGVGTYEADVQIFVNDVTVDSTEDGSVSANDGSHAAEYEPLKRREVTRKSVRRRSWCPEGRMRNVANDHRRDFKAEMLKSNGRSLSLSSLENGLGSEEDDAFHDARENPTPSLSQASLSNGQMSQPMERELSRGDSSPGPSNDGNSPEPDSSTSPLWSVQMRPERSLSTSSSVDTATSITPPNRNSADLSMIKMRAQTLQGSSLDNDQKSPVNSLLVPHSTLMQKSRSTPSLPEATSRVKLRQESEKVDTPKRKARDKQANLDKHLSLQNAIAEYDAQFRRQDEVEEDEDESLNQFLKNEDHKKSQISLTDFLNEHPSDSDEKVKAREKEEKRRRPSVFSKFTRGSHRGKKSKDKENKQKGQTHQFVSVSFSNSTQCNVCGRSLANKPAVRCESCMINVHENSCKEQIAPCLKLKQQQRVPQRDGMGPQAQGSAPKEKQSIFSASSGLRHVPSFKEKRSVSAPTRPQQPMGPGLNRSNTSPSSKVINEEGEHGNGPRPDMESTNIQDALSVSMESLDESTATSQMTSQMTDIDDDPEFLLTQQEAETWSVTVDKKTLKKMPAKDIKRQDTIWELIQTEIHYCRSLKILQRMFSHGMLTELHMSQEMVDKLFPNLDDLIDMHMSFLRNLRQLQCQRTDRCIEEIGPALVQQFSGLIGDRMKDAYGRFCSHKEKSVQLYKDFLKNDRKFHTFIKRCNMNILCERREIPGFLLHISLRITKYPILIESILKSTKDKRDRENLSQALFLSKSLLEYVDAEIDAYQREERLLQIYNRLDSKSQVPFKGKTFKKSDILSRKLIHEGVLSWRSARGKLNDVIVVVLSDCIVLLQENNQKYTFFSQDNKSSVISLYKLLVREKSDTRDSKGGIYLISQNKKEPEMYELVCKPTDKRETWINVVRSAAEQCPEEDEGVPTEGDEEIRLQEARGAKLKEIIEQMQKKDHEIKICCEEKNRLFTELLELYTREEPTLVRLHQAEKVEQQEVGDVLQAAIQEASRLTVMLQSGNGSTNLSRSVSSVGEHVSASYMTPPVPKRAETFAGFDSHETPKVSIVKKRFPTQATEVDDRSVSPVQYPHTDVTGAGGDAFNKVSNLSVKRPGSQVSLGNPQQRPLGDRDEPDGRGSDPAIDRDTLGELSLSSVGVVPPSREHVLSIAQLAQYLHTIVHLTAQQGTAVESLRAQLAEANERINKLSADMHDRKNVYRHNQLEELRNLQATVSRDRAKIDGERTKLFEEKMKLDQERNELVSKKEELQRSKEVLQRQVDMFQARETNLAQSSNLNKPTLSANSSSNLGKVHSSSSFYVPSTMSSDQISHKRSASAEYPQTSGTENNAGTSLNYKHVSQPGGNGRDSQGRPTHRYSVASFSGAHGRTDAQSSSQKLPVHLLSCTNEQKVGSSNAVPQGGSVQQVFPFKLANDAGSSPTTGMPGAQSAPQLGLPIHLAQSSGGSRMSSNPSSSSLGQVMRNKSLLKLAEPGSAGRARSSSQSNSSSTVPADPSQPPKPQPTPLSGEIYF